MDKIKHGDLSGQRFGSLVVLCQAETRITPSGEKRRMWHCRCNCGNEKDVDQQMLLSGRTKSCGCNRWVKENNASCQVHGERWSKGGFVTIDRAKEARDKAQAELIEKYNVKNPKGEKNA